MQYQPLPTTNSNDIEQGLALITMTNHDYATSSEVRNVSTTGNPPLKFSPEAFLLCCWEGGWCPGGKHHQMACCITLMVLWFGFMGSAGLGAATNAGALCLEISGSDDYFGRGAYNATTDAYSSDDDIDAFFAPSIVGGALIMPPYIFFSLFLLFNTVTNDANTSYRYDRLIGQSANIVFGVANGVLASVVGQYILFGSSHNVPTPVLAKASAIGMLFFTVGTAIAMHVGKPNGTITPDTALQAVPSSGNVV